MLTHVLQCFSAVRAEVKRRHRGKIRWIPYGRRVAFFTELL